MNGIEVWVIHDVFRGMVLKGVQGKLGKARAADFFWRNACGWLEPVKEISRAAAIAGLRILICGPGTILYFSGIKRV